MGADGVWSSAAAVEVEDRLYRALAALRIVLLVNTVALNLYRIDNFRHPAAVAVCLVVLVGWTAVALWAYDDRGRRTPVLLVADLGVTVVLLLVTPLVKGPDFSASVPGFWTMGALLAWSIHYRWVGGLCAGVLLAGVDVVVRPEFTQTVYGNVFLLVVGGPVVGSLCASMQRMATEREIAERVAATAAERARLARLVHDGVLQVLALVQRRGRELGGEVAALGLVAGEQERELRSLIREEAAEPAAGREGAVDLVVELGRLERRAGVTVATPAAPVELPAAAAREVVAVVAACLDNVTRHVGEDAPAWVLLEASPDRVELTVRDEGPGIPAGRLEEASADGRLGIPESIRGRIADLGGEATLSTGSFGTEWGLTVPRVSAASARRAPA